jgi:HEPN domain-containing protein
LSRLIETRAEFQEMAGRRLEEAKVLLDQGRWDGAYYLAGYAVELALKACIIKLLLTRDDFPEKEFSRNCYTHDLEKLVGLAGLESTW